MKLDRHLFADRGASTNVGARLNFGRGPQLAGLKLS
jgi:hypothetical protein